MHAIPERRPQGSVFAVESALLDSLEAALIAVRGGAPHEALVGIGTAVRAERDIENRGDHPDHRICRQIARARGATNSAPSRSSKPGSFVRLSPQVTATSTPREDETAERLGRFEIGIDRALGDFARPFPERRVVGVRFARRDPRDS